MHLLFLPATRRAINTLLIASIDEVDAKVIDPTRKNGEKTVPGVSVTLAGAHLIEEGDGDAIEEFPYSETFTGDDRTVLLAWRDHNLIRSLPYDLGSGEMRLTDVPIPKSAEEMDAPESAAVEEVQP